MIICWWSGGITSAVACKLAIEKYGKEKCKVILLDTGNEHDDTYRFKRDCEAWYGLPIEMMKSQDYENIQETWYRHKSLNTAHGAICSYMLKRRVREKWEKDAVFDHQVFGFEYDKKEMNRAYSLETNHPQTKPLFPLIEAKMSKVDCINLVQSEGIKIPEAYSLGYQNNNPCALDTEIMTDKGVFQIGDLLGKTVNVLTKNGFGQAVISDYDAQECYEMKLSKGRLKTKIVFSENHSWHFVRRNAHPLNRIIQTKDLMIGDFLPHNSLANLDEFEINPDYVAWGMCYGDGSADVSSSYIRFFGDKYKVLEELGFSINYSEIRTLRGLPRFYKTQLPELGDSLNNKLSFLAGFFAADGCVNKGNISSISTSDNKDYFIRLLQSCGIAVTSCHNNVNKGNYNKKGVLIKNTKPNWIIGFRVPEFMVLREKHRNNYRQRKMSPRGWRIDSIEKVGMRKVACATVLNGGHPTFTLVSGVLTGNCLGSGCVQGGIGYWKKIQKEMPEVFDRMAKVEHDLTDLKGSPVTMLKDQTNKAKKSGIQLVFLKAHPDYPQHKTIDEMRGRSIKPLMECNGFCGTNDFVEKNETEDELNFNGEFNFHK